MRVPGRLHVLLVVCTTGGNVGGIPAAFEYTAASFMFLASLWDRWLVRSTGEWGTRLLQKATTSKSMRVPPLSRTRLLAWSISPQGLPSSPSCSLLRSWSLHAPARWGSPPRLPFW